MLAWCRHITQLLRRINEQHLSNENSIKYKAIVRSARCLGAQFPAPCGAANNLQSNIPNIQTMSNPNIFVTNVKFRGWYDAPFPFGKTEFTLTIETHDDTDGSFRKGPALTLFTARIILI